MNLLSVTLVQSNIFWEDKETNLSYLSEKLGALPKASKIVFLPEMFATGFSMKSRLAEDMDGLIINWMRRKAKEWAKIICGSVMIRKGLSIYNRLIWMLPNGLVYYYDKRHLFAFGGEDKVFTPGNKRVMVQVNGWKICLMVCYDLRFPVWCRQQEGTAYDILVFVANWPEKRNHAWKTLLQARAIENQCYVIGVNRVGVDGLGIRYSGDSMIIDPLGKISKVSPEAKETLLHFDLASDLLQVTRDNFPFLKDSDGFLLT